MSPSLLFLFSGSRGQPLANPGTGNLGFIVYTGDDTKIRCNVKQETKKIQKSTVMRIVDRGTVVCCACDRCEAAPLTRCDCVSGITGMLIIQIIMCIFAGTPASQYVVMVCCLT